MLRVWTQVNSFLQNQFTFFLFWGKKKMTVTLEFELKSTQHLGRQLSPMLRQNSFLPFMRGLGRLKGDQYTDEKFWKCTDFRSIIACCLCFCLISKLKCYNCFDVMFSFLYHLKHGLATDTQWSLFSLKSQTFGLGQTIWANKSGGIWGIFGRRLISTHFGTVNPLSMFSINQPIFLKKN